MAKVVSRQYKHSGFVITNPTAGSDEAVLKFPYKVEIKKVHLLCRGDVVVGQLAIFDANGANGAKVDGSDITGIVGTTVSDDGALSNAIVPAGYYIGWITTSVTGTPTRAIINFEYV